MLQTILRVGSRTFIPELRCVLFAIVIGFLSLSAEAQVPLSNGGNHTGTIPANASESFTFAGTAGESIILRAGGTNVVPKIELIAPNGTSVATAPASAPGAGSRDALLENTLSASGTFTVKVSSYYANGTGPYSLRFVQIPGTSIVPPGDEGGPLVSGAVANGVIELGDLDVWTFDANSGDSIQLRMGGTNVVPLIKLYGPNGTLIQAAPETAPGGGNRDAVIATRLAVGGKFTVVASSYYFNGGGGYSLSFLRAPGDVTVSPGDQGGPLTNGAKHNGFIDVGEFDVWTFDGTAADSIQLRMGGTNLVPWIHLYGPDGSLVQVTPTVAPGGGSRDTIISTRLTTTGKYIVVTSGYYFNSTGSYGLSFVKVPGTYTTSPGDQGGLLTNGETVNGNVDTGDFDVWTFSANSGDSIELRMGGVNLVPWMHLYGPDGALVQVAPETAPGGGSRDAIISTRLAMSGTFTLVTSGYYPNSAGDYSVSFLKAPGEIAITPGDEGGALTNGFTYSGSIDIGDVDAWTFEGRAGNNIEIRLGGTNVVPWIHLYGPDGALVDVVPDNAPGGGSRDAALYNVKLPASGTYTVTVGSYYFNGGGGYTLTLVQGASDVFVAPGDEGGSMTNGYVYNGTNSVGDLDTWSFYGTPGDSNIFRIGTVNYTPWLRLYGPSGELVKEAFTAGAGVRTNQLSFIVTNAGNYTLISEAYFLNQSGTFNLKQSRFPPDLNMPAQTNIDEGTTLNIPISAQDPDEPNKGLTFLLQSAPPGVAINTLGPTNAVIVWSPTEADGPSTNTFRVTVTDLVNGVSFVRTNTFTVVINEVNVAPVLTVPADTQVNELTPLNVTVTATDADIPKNNLTFSLIAPPEGMTIDSASGAISWVPTEAQGPGSYPVKVAVTDDNALAINEQHLSTTNSFTVTVREVNTAPFVTIGDQAVDEGKAFSATVVVADGDLPLNGRTFALVDPPQGLTIDPTTGVLSWTPTEAQGPSTNAVTVTVTDDNPAAVNEAHLSTSKTFIIVVNEVNSAPVFAAVASQTVDELKTLTVGSPATDSDLPTNTLSYALVNPPVGATVSPQGVVTWTPTEAQGPTNVTIVVVATDNGTPALSGTNTFNVGVNELNTAPVIADIAEQSGPVGLPFTIPTEVTDNDLPPNQITLALENAPSGMSVDAATGTINWTPSAGQIGVFSVTLKATDDGSPAQSASKVLKITVTSPDARLAATALSNNRIQVDITANQAHTYNLERSTDLATWETVLQVPLVDGKYTHVEAMNAGHRFYRLKQIQ